jgi:hypothetical protein
LPRGTERRWKYTSTRFWNVRMIGHDFSSVSTISAPKKTLYTEMTAASGLMVNMPAMPPMMSSRPEMLESTRSVRAGLVEASLAAARVLLRHAARPESDMVTAVGACQ